MSLKTWYIGRTVKSMKEDAVSGKSGDVAKAIWVWLDGKKVLIWTGVMAAKVAFPHLGLWGFVDAAAGAVGWDHIAPAVDPDALVTWITAGIAFGHKLEKALNKPEWKVIGPAPEIKEIPKLVEVPEVGMVVPTPVLPPIDPSVFDMKSKAILPIGTRVVMQDGRSVVVMLTKESSSQGFTYAVREVN